MSASSSHHRSTHFGRAALAHTVAHKREHRRPAPRTLLLLLCALHLALAIALAGCSTWGAGHRAEAALELDLQDPDRAVLAPLERDLEPNERFWIRLQLGAPTEADHVIVRLEKDVGGRSYFERQNYRFDDVTPPWNVAAIPLNISETGDWNIALIVNSRKITDVKVSVEYNRDG